MRSKLLAALLWSAVAACLGWAVVEARHLDWRSLGTPVAAPTTVDRIQVEDSFSGIREELASGSPEQAVLALRHRTEHGPHRGTAWFLLGEVAASQGAHTASVGHYRKAVELDPAIADHHGPFGSGTVIAARLTALLEGSWSAQRPPEIDDLYYLRRRLGGGCE